MCEAFSEELSKLNREDLVHIIIDYHNSASSVYGLIKAYNNNQISINNCIDSITLGPANIINKYSIKEAKEIDALIKYENKEISLEEFTSIMNNTTPESEQLAFKGFEQEKSEQLSLENKKSKKKKKQKYSYYAVKRGRKPGIYTTWEECKKNTQGYSNAVYKGFKTEKEAKAFMNVDKNKEKAKDAGKGLVAYVDGSYDSYRNVGSYACIFFYEDGTRGEKSGRINDKMVSMNNVGGEVTAAIKAFEEAVKKKSKVLHIYYDYLGIENWCNGTWTARKEYTKRYVQKYKNTIKKGIKIYFHKVEAHTGDPFNEEVDSLAKKALSD